MIWIEATCIFHGERYSPSKAERLSKLCFLEKNEPEEIGTVGRFKGLPLPYGSSTLWPPCQITPDNADYGTEWLVDKLIEHRSAFKAAGADTIILSLDVYHDGQCNLEFSPELLRKIADSSVPMILSCYEDSHYVSIKIQNTSCGN